MNDLIERIEAEMIRCAEAMFLSPVASDRTAYREAAAEYATILIALKARAYLKETNNAD